MAKDNKNRKVLIIPGKKTFLRFFSILGFCLAALPFQGCLVQKVEAQNSGGRYAKPNPDTYRTTAQAVDLGLSVKWASWNVGASKPEEYGGYFGWADVTGKKTSTSNDDYPSANPPANICGTEYDAARAHWGVSWRLPTREEQEELVNRASWTKTKLNNVDGYRVTGPNGNSIFLPAGGGRIGTTIHYRVSGADFWSGTLSANTEEAHYMWFYGGRQAVEDLPRHYGFSIRPVME